MQGGVRREGRQQDPISRLQNSTGTPSELHNQPTVSVYDPCPFFRQSDARLLVNQAKQCGPLDNQAERTLQYALYNNPITNRIDIAQMSC